MDKDKYELAVPYFHENDVRNIADGVITEASQSEVRTVTMDELIEAISELGFYNPDVPVAEFIIEEKNRFGKEICLTALWNPFFQMLWDLEAMASTYNTMPFKGGLLDQPFYIFSAFESMQRVKAEFQKIALKKQQQKNENQKSNVRR